MKRSRYEQDPDGDVDFVLRDPDGLRRDWPEGYRKRQRTEEATYPPARSVPAPAAVSQDPNPNHSRHHNSQSNRPLGTAASAGNRPPVADIPSSPQPDEDVDYDYEDYDDEDDDDEDDEEDEYLQERPAKRFRVSSRHLSLASPVFSQMLNGPWKDATKVVGTDASATSDPSVASGAAANSKPAAAAADDASGPSSDPSRREIEASEWDTDATVILLDIIHGHFSQVPRSLSLVMLAKVAILVDYYKCHEIVSVFSGLWIEGLKRESAAAATAAGLAVPASSTSSYPGAHCLAGGSFVFGAGGGGAGGVVTRSTTAAATVSQGIALSHARGNGDALGLWQEECFLWLFISWVFGEGKLFSAMADMFLRKSPLPISSIAFPLPEGLLTALDTARTSAIESVLTSITKLRDDLISGSCNPCPYGMTFECSSMLLGSLIKGLRSLNLSPPLRETYNNSDTSHPVGCSLLGMQNSFARLKRPVWYNIVASAVNSRGVVAHQCNLRGRLDGIVRAVVEGLPRFRLDDFATSALRSSGEEMKLAVAGGET